MTDRRALTALLRVCSLAAICAVLHLPVAAQTLLSPALSLMSGERAEADGTVRGPIRLQTSPLATDAALSAAPPAPAPAPIYVPGEFEKFVQNLAGSDTEVRRFGAELTTGGTDGRSAELSPLVPSDYVVSAGDEVLVTLWGSVDADLRLIVDRSGRISIPRIGTVQVSGVRYGDLPDVVSRRVAQVFRNFQISVTLGQLRGIRIFVTGFVLKPGAYTVTSLSTVVAALMRAGGPSAAGSFRNVALRRGADLVSQLDLYDLLLKGDRTADRIVQAGDVVHVGPIGTQVGIVGSINRAAIFELKAGETVADLIGMAGGFSAVADRTRVAVERLQQRNDGRVAQLELPRDLRSSLSHGDVVRVFSAVSSTLSTQRQNKRIKVDGEVQKPGEYILADSSSVSDALRAAGGYTPAAYVFATELTRVSVQRTQQENYDRALRDLETDIARASMTQGRDASIDGAAPRLVERLRALRPTGRIVMQIDPNASELPDIALEDGDHLYVPSRPTTVGVFGSVFNAASYLHSAGRSLDDYLRLAGGATKGADQGSAFVVRANGNVVSNRQSGSWLNRSGSLLSLPAEPGDTLFLPEEMDKTTFTQAAKEWTQIMFQFGLGVAGIKSAVR